MYTRVSCGAAPQTTSAPDPTAARATPGRFSTTLSTSPDAPGTLRPSSTGTSVETTFFSSGGRVGHGLRPALHGHRHVREGLLRPARPHHALEHGGRRRLDLHRERVAVED